MLSIFLAFIGAAVVLPALARWIGRGVFPLAALVAAAGFVQALVHAPEVAAGGVLVESMVWIDQLDLSVSFVMDPLGLLLALVVTGVGALVLLYCARYFRGDDARIGVFAGTFMAFAGAMYGLVLADDVYLLFIFWEATSVFSYLLIGHSHQKRASRSGALQALLVTTLGGLVMLVGFVLLVAEGGTTSLRELIAEPPSGPVVTVAIMLVLVGALSKSAIFPFHFWLPGAMAAPTPVSAYLHAAAMVKAGVYLVLRLGPGFAATPGWSEVLVTLGLVTLLLGGIQALRQTDLKQVLAHGTVSQLGMLVAIAGFGTAEAALAGIVLLLAHALFKSALFLIVGIVDQRMGTRDLREITGLGRRAPVLAAAAIIAVSSMAGLPPLFGFVAKEAVFAAVLEVAEAGDAVAWLVLAALVAGAVLTLAYGIRFVWGAFGDKRPERVVPRDTGGIRTMRVPSGTERGFMVGPAVVLVVLTLALGPFAAIIDPLATASIAGYADAAEAPHVEFWHGVGLALAASGVSIALGLGLAAVLRRREERDPRAPFAERVYRAVVGATDRVAAWLTAQLQRGSLPFYLGVIYLVVALALVGALLNVESWSQNWELAQGPVQFAAGLVMVVGALAAARAQKRFAGAILVGVTGTGMAAIFATQGAPDLALTQLLVEVVTLVAFVLVLRRLPARLGEHNGSTNRIPRALLGVTVGLAMAAVAIVATGVRVDEPISLAWPELAYEQGHGRNVVNVALVDIRAWDTLGELSVVIAAATGVASLIFVSSRRDDLPRVGRRAARASFRKRRLQQEEPLHVPVARGSWLLAGRTLSPENRSILLEVVVRLIFHALIVVSVYLLLVGHNAPGGGFAGGLVVGLALTARYLAGGRRELGAAAPFDAGVILGVGLLTAASTAVIPLFFGVDALTSTWFTLSLGIFGEIDLVTSMFFDIGVYLVVVGLALDVLRSLGAEVDRQSEDAEAGTASRRASGEVSV